MRSYLMFRKTMICLVNNVNYITKSAIHHQYLKEPLTTTIISAPFSGGQPKGGVERGPYVLMRQGIVDQLRGIGWTVDLEEQIEDFNKFKPASDPNIGLIKNARFTGAVTRHVANLVENAAKKRNLPLTIGGDHSLAIGTISGTAAAYPEKDMCVLWIDAHADINTIETSASGNLHGCPVSFLLGLSGTKLPGFEWLKPCVKTNRITFIGLRDLEMAERQILKKHNIKAFSMHEVDKYGIGRVVEMALDHINPSHDLPIHLSFDVDALDETVTPSTGTPVRGGLTMREGHYICEAVWLTGLLAGLDVLEVNPLIGDKTAQEQTVSAGCSVIRAAMGETLL